MGFLSSLFGNNKKEKTYIVDGLGTFTYDGIHFNIHRWDGDIEKASISVIGGFEKPFDDQIQLVKNVNNLIENLNSEIINSLEEVETDNEVKTEFKSWEEMFVLVAADFDDFYSKKLWCFTLEEKNTKAQYYFELEENKIINCTKDT